VELLLPQATPRLSKTVNQLCKCFLRDTRKGGEDLRESSLFFYK
jgi:hypothetical protein